MCFVKLEGYGDYIKPEDNVYWQNNWKYNLKSGLNLVWRLKLLEIWGEKKSIILYKLEKTQGDQVRYRRSCPTKDFRIKEDFLESLKI